MTVSRAPAEPEVREFEATVAHVDDREVVLEETHFYAASGGQPADRGTLGGALVEDVVERDGEVVHVLESTTDIEPGDEVTGIVDDAFRTYCMRAHTASHVLYGAARRICEDLGYAGFDITPEKVRVDLTTAEPLDDDDLVELERLSNRAVWDSHPVTWETMSEEAARELETIAFNTKTEEGAMSGGEAVRVVTVGGDGSADDVSPSLTAETWDVAACGGTHVRNTAAIGPIEVLDRSNPGEGVTRVEFAVGPTAIDRDAAVHAAALSAATAADASVDELPAEVERLREENDRLEAELGERTDELLTARLREFPTRAIGDAIWAIGTLENAAANDVQDPAEAILGGEESTTTDAPDTADAADEAPDVIAAVGVGDAPFAVIAATPDSAVDAGAVVDELTAEFGGGGGGGPTFAQGGGLDADAGDVVDWLRDR